MSSSASEYCGGRFSLTTITHLHRRWLISHNIDIIGMPPHTSHALQPLDVGLFGPVKAKHVKMIKTVRDAFKDEELGNAHIAPIFLLAYYEVAKRKASAVNAFRACGVYPACEEGDEVWTKLMNQCIDSPPFECKQIDDPLQATRQRLVEIEVQKRKLAEKKYDDLIKTLQESQHYKDVESYRVASAKRDLPANMVFRTNSGARTIEDTYIELATCNKEFLDQYLQSPELPPSPFCCTGSEGRIRMQELATEGIQKRTIAKEKENVRERRVCVCVTL